VHEPLITNRYRVSLTCVIVDDNAVFLQSAADLLSRKGLDVVGVASDSAAAIRLVTARQPDVTLVDIDLGGEDGFELAQQLTDLSAEPSSVILISTYPEEDLAHLIAASPAIGFVSKTRLSARAIRDTLETRPRRLP
jgi:DNA-binding NarL/FixJ family response regulator